MCIINTQMTSECIYLVKSISKSKSLMLRRVLLSILEQSANYIITALGNMIIISNAMYGISLLTVFVRWELKILAYIFHGSQHMYTSNFICVCVPLSKLIFTLNVVCASADKSYSCNGSSNVSLLI